jgi:hypothetical protein
MWGDTAGGLDPISANLLLDIAKKEYEETGGTDTSADLYKAFTADEANSNAVLQAHKVYEALGYKEWAIVEAPESWALGKIVWLNTSTQGMYPWDRYPIYVRLATGNVYEYSLLSTDYSKVPWYIGKEQQLIADYGDKLQWKVVKELPNADEIMQQQKALYEMNRDEVLAFIDTHYPVAPTQKDYVYQYAFFCIEKWVYKNIKNIQEIASFIENEQFLNIKNPAVKDLILTKYFDHLARSYTYDDEIRYSETLPALIGVYATLTNIDYKAKLQAIIFQRAQKLEGNDFYNFVTATAGTDLEEIAMVELEKRTQ